jgi:hypothetical protein
VAVRLFQAFALVGKRAKNFPRQTSRVASPLRPLR